MTKKRIRQLARASLRDRWNPILEAMARGEQTWPNVPHCVFCTKTYELHFGCLSCPVAPVCDGGSAEPYKDSQRYRSNSADSVHRCLVGAAIIHFYLTVLANQGGVT